jgi:hypothetical protein
VDCNSRGYNSMNIIWQDGMDRFFNVMWQCDTSDTTSQCTCSATYNYGYCSRCEICSDNEPGEFSLDCPGYSIDCNNNYTLSKYEVSSVGFNNLSSVAKVLVATISVSLILF